MRQLIAALVLSCSSAALATDLIVFSQSDYSRFRYPLAPFDDPSQSQAENFKQSVGLRAEKFLSQFHYSFQVDYQKIDPDNIVLRDSQLNVYPLRLLENKENIFSARGAIGWSKAGHRITLELQHDLLKHAYMRRGAGLSYQFNNLALKQNLQANLVYQKEDAPTDYFLNADFLLQKRPETVHAMQADVSFEQGFLERFKARLGLLVAERQGERPIHYGIQSTLAAALHSRFYARFDQHYLWEPKYQELLNERGYLEAQIYKFTLTVEPVFDLLVSGSYALVREIEDNPAFGYKTQIGSDQYSLFVARSWDSFSLKAGGAFVRTNTQRRDWSGSLSMEYQI